MKKFYMPEVEELDAFTWKVILINVETGKPITWVKVDKSEYPTKEDAAQYLIDRYESEDDYDKRVSQIKGLMPTRMMIDYIGRKKKSKKPKTKRCRCKK